MNNSIVDIGDDMESENIFKYTVSNHARERYAQRIMGRESTIDVNHYIALNKEKIQNDINKLIMYGQLIYSGKQSKKDGKNTVVDVFLKDTWIVLADNKTRNVITLYKIDLGLDDDFNKTYISKMMDKLNGYKEVLASVQQQIQNESDAYKEMIEDAEAQIKEYRSNIKNLEELCTGYKTIIENNNVKVSQVNRDVVNTLNQLIGKKEF